ncbi:DUF169 domain-containing protein [Clostridium sp. MD294]|uniref:DUF169 domain-containing protein n=1 Tax=Clostridium sp. MD294 TaxID=97138 RepID=UPI0002CBAB7A|nr:DUF169 domain-containing protein [Clostridium sp. MD294]NDO47855.1 hypothetical protein [Clostridium sp. MD294]USF29824.1 hypothetical protein C820_001232 [Clostridium sp. MD294]
MTSKIAELLKCSRMPVALIRTNQKPEQALMFKEGNKGCVIALLNVASQGKISALSEETIGCPGGKSGTGFKPFQLGKIEYFLSTGGKENKEGEYYKESPELARTFINGLPSIESKKFIVLKPYNLLNEYEIPHAVIFLVNADELSALVTLANYDKPTQDNVEIKFGAGCAQTFLYSLANQDNGKDICTIGLTDPSARKCIDKDLLSFSIPYRRFCIMEEKAKSSFLTHDTWKTLLKRKGD